MKHRSRRSPLFPALALPLLALPLASQTLTTVTLPNGTDAVDAVGSNTLPWGRAQNGPARAQYLYDTSHFAAQGISQEIEIRHLRWRSNATATTWAGGVYFNVVVGLSSSSRDALLPSTTFAVNQGTNHTVVYNGSVMFAPGTATASAPGPVVIDIPLSTPFRFDPSLGQDLLIDIDIPPGQWVGGTVVACDAQSTSPGCSRISATATYGGPTGTISNGQQALVVELGYVLTDFLDADFVASVTSGPSPLTVTFSDLSTTSDPSGVVAWAWDFDNDGLIDSTLQNPTHTFSSCGSYSVSLQVSDTQHAPDTETILDYIVTDEVVPDFTIQHLGGTTFLFTDTSTPPATAVNWDLDGDQVVDATGSTTTFSYTSTCIATNVTMSASRQCMGPFPITKAVALSPGQVATTTTAGTSTSGSGFDWPGILFDVRVTNPQGIVICALSLPSGASSGHVEFDVNITEGSYVGKDTSPAEWRLAAWGGFDAPETTASNPQLTVVPLPTPIYLPQGDWGMSVWVNDFVGTASFSSSPLPIGPFASADLVVHPNPTAAPGLARSDWFGGTAIPSQSFVGILHYTAAGPNLEGGFGYFAPGCDGAYGKARQFVSQPPRIGQQLDIQIDGLPFDAAFMLMGFSRTVSAYGLLPIDLGSLGAPGCPVHVSDDITGLCFGQFNAATWSLAVPPTTALVGLQFYTQGFVFDAGWNSFGFVTSDAHAGILGL